MLPPYSLVTPRLIAAFIVLRRNGSNHPYAFYSTFVVLSFLHLLKIATFAKALLHQGSCAGSLCLADEVGAAFLFYVSHAQRDVHPCAFVVLVLGTEVLFRWGRLVALLDDLHALNATLVAILRSCNTRLALMLP